MVLASIEQLSKSISHVKFQVGSLSTSDITSQNVCPKNVSINRKNDRLSDSGLKVPRNSDGILLNLGM